MYRHPDLAEITYRVLLWSKNYDRGLSIILLGGTGVGKSALARIAYKTFPLGSATFVTEPALFQDLKDGFDSGRVQEKLRRLNHIPVLFLDDIGTLATKSPEWVQEVYWQILDQRHEGSRATFVTTNLAVDQLWTWLGQRAMSRLMASLMTQDLMIDMFHIPDIREEKTFERSLDSLLDDGLLEI